MHPDWRRDTQLKVVAHWRGDIRVRLRARADNTTPTGAIMPRILNLRAKPIDLQPVYTAAGYGGAVHASKTEQETIAVPPS